MALSKRTQNRDEVAMLDALKPRLIQRKCGGWLAVSNDADPVRIGVAAVSEAEANREFQKVRERWQVILESDAAAKVAFAPAT